MAAPRSHTPCSNIALPATETRASGSGVVQPCRRVSIPQGRSTVPEFAPIVSLGGDAYILRSFGAQRAPFSLQPVC